MAAGNLDDPLSDIPNIVVVDQSAATAAPGAGYVRVEAVNGVLGLRVGSGAWVPLVTLAAGLLSSLTEKASPASGDWLLLQDTADSDELKKVDVDNLPGGTGGGVFDAYVNVQHQETQNTAGGTFNSGAWRTRPLNVEEADTGGIASLAANRITLPAGSYVVSARAQAFSVAYHQLRLYDVTGAATLLTGHSQWSSEASGGLAQDTATLSGRFTLAQESAIELQHYSTGSQADSGFGLAANITTEVYATVEIWRLA